MESRKRLRKTVTLLSLCLVGFGSALVVGGNVDAMFERYRLAAELARDFGVAMLIAGITGLAFELVLHEESGEQWREQAHREMRAMHEALLSAHSLLHDAAEAGIVRTYGDRRDVMPLVAELLRGARRRIWLAGTTLRPLRDIPGLADLLAKKAEEIDVRIAVASPDSDWIKERGRQESAEGEGESDARRLQHEAEEMLEFLTAVSERCSDTRALAFGAYRTFPLCCAMLIDDAAFVGPYLYAYRGTDTYFLALTAGGYVFSQVETHLDRLLQATRTPSGGSKGGLQDTAPADPVNPRRPLSR